MSSEGEDPRIALWQHRHGRNGGFVGDALRSLAKFRNTLRGSDVLREAPLGSARISGAPRNSARFREAPCAMIREVLLSVGIREAPCGSKRLCFIVALRPHATSGASEPCDGASPLLSSPLPRSMQLC